MNLSDPFIAAILTAISLITVEFVRQWATRGTKHVDDAMAFRHDLLERIEKLEEQVQEEQTARAAQQQEYYKLYVQCDRLQNDLDTLRDVYDQLNAHVDDVYTVVRTLGLDWQKFMQAITVPRPRRLVPRARPLETRALAKEGDRS